MAVVQPIKVVHVSTHLVAVASVAIPQSFHASDLRQPKTLTHAPTAIQQQLQQQLRLQPQLRLSQRQRQRQRARLVLIAVETGAGMLHRGNVIR